ncbi:hypothetical protein HJC23_004727 [Cyclotella cryptica]|uniref:Uncharacterized protein n=1 Tax=Cyclotella cryptica TaxID=29204 RepID=A0ABD3NL80_9STRA|eukprot:CCRYP_020524-RA/>CCRYP_020524-RA protein AED:0.00 eAED:0.00 QI:195/-1/1/1/-1/1/1/453/347
MSSPNNTLPHQRRRRRPPRSPPASAATFAALAIFASSQRHYTNANVVQPRDLPVHSPSDPIPWNANAKQQPPIEYYPPPLPEEAPSSRLQRHQTNTKHTTKKRTKTSSKKTTHQSHSPWHTADFLPSRLGSSQNGDTPTKNQVILRPRPSYSSNASLSTTSNGKQVYYYDPSSLASRGKESEPTLTLPEVIYDAEGRVKKLEEIHDGGRNDVFLEVKPKAVWGENWKGKESSFHLNEKLALYRNAGMGSTQSPDQMIVFGTIATMAILVGALSARRMRHKRLLEHCMEPDLEEDWEDEEEEDKGAPPKGAGIMYRGYGETPMGGGGRKYESFGGNLHWRGDLEKFDV